jgi:hypothetical protein
MYNIYRPCISQQYAIYGLMMWQHVAYNNHNHMALLYIILLRRSIQNTQITNYKLQICVCNV